MIPYRVTITGVDNYVSPFALIRLSEEFPFVEWGILRSASRGGEYRYPTNSWVIGLHACVRDVAKTPKPRFSFHLCGQIARETMQGDTCHLTDTAWDKWWMGRIQINGYVPGQYEGLAKLASSMPNKEFILQCRSEADLPKCADDATKIPGSVVLFDPSGGRGISATVLPPTPPGCHLGFAGGIGPDNVLDVIKAIGDREPYWIDMESGVRDKDRFNVDKVRSVLEQVATLIQRGEP